MLKKWISSGDERHEKFCNGGDSCDCKGYHGGTGLLFDYINLFDEEYGSYNTTSAQTLPEFNSLLHINNLSLNKGTTIPGCLLTEIDTKKKRKEYQKPFKTQKSNAI